MSSVRSLARIAPLVVLTCVLAACGSESTDMESAPTAAAEEKLAGGEDFSDGYPLPDCDAASGELCITNGFDPAVDGFGFANWGESGAIGATEMIALFGRKKVCASGSGSSCVLYPAAQDWAAQVNESMAGGHCEGMAVLSARLFGGDDDINQLEPGAESTFDLDPGNRDVISAIEMWFATQYLDPVVSAYKSYQELTPTEIASALIDGLEDGSGYTLGIYSDDGGHAVTPLGVSIEGDLVAISIYDNNYPGTVQRVMVDPDQETWSYAGGTTEPNAPTNGWGGTTGTIELTPMDSRALPAPAPFAEKRAKGRNAAGKQVIMVTSPDPSTNAGAVLDVAGTSYDLSDAMVIEKLPEGVQVRFIRSDTLTAGSTIVDIDPTLVSDYMISATTTNPSGATVPVTMSIDSVNEPRITMRTDSPAGETGAATFSVDESGAVGVSSATGSMALVSVANGLRGATFDLESDNSLLIDTDEDGVASVDFFDEEGEPLGSYAVDPETEDGSVSLADIVFDPETGEFDVTDEEVEAEEVDTDFLVLVEDLVDDSGADEGTDEGAPADEGTDESAPADEGTDEGAPADEGTDEGAPADEGTDEGAPADEGTDEGRVEDAPQEEEPADTGDSNGGEQSSEE